MILHMLNTLADHSVIKCYLLFPTIERIAESPLGKYAAPLVKHFGWMAHPAMYLPYYMVPDSLKRRILAWYFSGKASSQLPVGATLKISDPGSVGLIARLGHEEMEQVVEADHLILQQHLAKLHLHYGTRDHWCPVTYYQDMRARYPAMDITLCNRGYEHAFVLKASTGMAQLTWHWITNLNLDI